MVKRSKKKMSVKDYHSTLHNTAEERRSPWILIGLATCVIAQQYSSATFVSLRFHSRSENSARV
jgi:hypothetical protein